MLPAYYIITMDDFFFVLFFIIIHFSRPLTIIYESNSKAGVIYYGHVFHTLFTLHSIFTVSANQFYYLHARQWKQRFWATWQKVRVQVISTPVLSKLGFPVLLKGVPKIMKIIISYKHTHIHTKHVCTQAGVHSQKKM